MRVLKVDLALVLFLLLLLTIFHVEPNQVLAGRVLNMKKKQLSLEALDKGPVTPSGPSGCTYIPGTGGTHCPVKEMNVAGSAQHHRARAAYPRLVVPFGVATNQH